MNTTLLAAIVVVAVAVVLLLRLTPSAGSARPGYRRKPNLLSKAERSFYGVLVQAVGDNALIFAKVRVADVLAPQKGLSRANWQQAFNRISAKHVGFLLCDPQDCAVKLAIELDDASHDSATRKKRDSFLDSACESADLPLLRIKAARGYAVADLRRQIDALLSPVQETPPLDNAEQFREKNLDAKAAEPQEAPGPGRTEPQPEKPPEDLANTATTNKQDAPACQKCGSDMVLRKARSGKHAGQAFWGCSAFPKCRGAVRC